MSSRPSPLREFVKLVAIGVAVVSLVILLVTAICSFKIVSPGHRGVKVTLGKVSPAFVGEGLTWKMPYLTGLTEVSVQQETRETKAPCFSSDLQQVDMTLKVLFRRPEQSVVRLYQDYKAGDVFDALVSPRVQEAIKEVTAAKTAEGIVKTREAVKVAALAAARAKLTDDGGRLIEIDDIVIENIDLSDQLEQAIEAKMVQEQEASKSRFVQEKAKIEAETSIITANAAAESIRIQGEALKATPDLVSLKIVERWNGVSPLYVGGGGSGGGANVILPVRPTEDR